MSIDEIVRVWKADNDDQDKQDEDEHGKDKQAPPSPISQELSDEELEKIVGGQGGKGPPNTES